MRTLTALVVLKTSSGEAFSAPIGPLTEAGRRLVASR
jgi:hypothetical protein